MTSVCDIDNSSFDTSKPKTEINRSVTFLYKTDDNKTISRSDPSKENLYNPPEISTTLKSSADNKTESLYKRKFQLLQDRSRLLNSLWFRFFNFGYKKVQIIDRELNTIEEEIISLQRHAFQENTYKTKELLRNTKANILRYKDEIQKYS